MDDVPCRGLGWLFFSNEEQDIAQAMQICRSCSHGTDCYAGALERREACGVWGGRLLRDGQVLDAVPRAGRPRKAA